MEIQSGQTKECPCAQQANEICKHYILTEHTASEEWLMYTIP